MINFVVHICEYCSKDLFSNIDFFEFKQFSLEIIREEYKENFVWITAYRLRLYLDEKQFTSYRERYKSDLEIPIYLKFNIWENQNSKTLLLRNIPISDPQIEYQVYKDENGFLKISSGKV